MPAPYGGIIKEINSCTWMGMTGTPRIPRKSRGHGNKYRGIPVGCKKKCGNEDAFYCSKDVFAVCRSWIKEAVKVTWYDLIIIIIIIIQYLYSAIMSYADTEALVAPV